MGVDVIELRRLCGKHQIVPKSYKLEGVEREGGHAQCLSQVTEIWKGTWDGKVVALKVLKVPRGDPGLQKTKSVSTPYDLWRIMVTWAIALTGGVAILQGSGIDEATR